MSSGSCSSKSLRWLMLDGRKDDQNIPRALRLCSRCTTNEVGDEFHLFSAQNKNHYREYMKEQKLSTKLYIRNALRKWFEK